MKALNYLFFTLALLATTVTSFAGAEPITKFPSKMVTIVVPYTPGSGSDIIARILTPKLAARWGQAVIVENKTGASGNIGANKVATATPDGHTLLLMAHTFSMTPSLYKSMPFDAVADFTPVAKLAEASYTFAVNPGVPAKDMTTMIAYIKKNGGRLNYATPGSGTPQHLIMEILKKQSGLEILHVPYKGLQGAVTDLIGGQVQMMISTVQSMRGFAQAGKVRMLAVTGLTRNPLTPDVPTFREQGITVMDNVDSWFAVMAPAHTPPEAVERLNRDFIEAINSADVKSQLEAQGLSVRTSTPAQLGALVKSDLLRWQKVITDAGITAN